MTSGRRGLLWGLTAVVVLAALYVAGSSAFSRAPRWRVYAVQYGFTPRYGAHSLLAGAPTGETRPLAWLVWVIRGEDRVILVDTGIVDPAEAKQRGIQRFQPVEERLAGLGLRAGEITDVILTHSHWDHAGGLVVFPDARLWVQRREVEWARATAGTTPAVELDDVAAMSSAIDQGKAELLDGDGEVAPGVLCHLGGLHTPGTQWVEVQTGRETIVLTSDEAYLYENLDDHRATGSTSDRKANVRELAAMAAVASRPELLVPGHDPEVMKRFPRRAAGVVEIE